MFGFFKKNNKDVSETLIKLVDTTHSFLNREIFNESICGGFKFDQAVLSCFSGCLVTILYFHTDVAGQKQSAEQKKIIADIVAEYVIRKYLVSHVYPYDKAVNEYQKEYAVFSQLILDILMVITLPNKTLTLLNVVALLTTLYKEGLPWEVDDRIRGLFYTEHFAKMIQIFQENVRLMKL